MLRLFQSAFILLTFTYSIATTSADQAPNIVMIISDDQSWTDYGFMGHPDIQTPNLDRLAARSATFRRGYVPVALCRPSLVTMITGLYPHQHGVTGNDPWRFPQQSDAEYDAVREKLIARIDRFDTLPKLLAQKGYLSHQSGKWWEGNFSRGGFTHGMTRGFPQKGGRHGDDGLAIGRNGIAAVADFVDMSVEQDKPFFLWYAPFLPHTPHNPPARILQKYQAKNRPASLAKYYAMCDWFDETCGQVLDHIEKSGVSDNTMVVYVTDNGWVQRTPDMELPLKWKDSYAPKSKQSPYDGGTRTPIMISWPAKIKAQERPEVVSSIDLMPTILAAAGIDAPDNLPGKNLLPVIDGAEQLSRDRIFGESFAHDVADIDDPEETLLYRWVIEGKWKLLLTYDGKVNRYSIVHPRTENRPQLFDLLKDPNELSNLAEANPEVVARLAQSLDEWWKVKNRSVQTTWTKN